MKASVEVHGNEKNINGIIVGFNPENSGFIYNGDFEEQDIEDIGYNLVLEIATNIKFEDLVYLPSHKDKFTSNDEKSDTISPIVNNPQNLETETVLIQHRTLESADITTLKELKEDAYEYLDSEYPSYLLWRELRGCEINLSGVNVNNTIVADSISVSKQDNISISDENIIKNIKQKLQNKYDSKMNDTNLNCYEVIRIKNNIMHISYYIDDNRIGEPMEGIIELKNGQFEIVS